MTKRQYQPVVSTVQQVAPIWQDRLGLAHFEIEHAFLDTFDGEIGDGSDHHTTAVCEVRWQYMQAKIKWYLPSAVRHSEEQLEETCIHELCHVLLGAEQSLVDVQLDLKAKELTDDESDILQKQYYERLELTTELTARAVFRGWGSALKLITARSTAA